MNYQIYQMSGEAYFVMKNNIPVIAEFNISNFKSLEALVVQIGRSHRNKSLTFGTSPFKSEYISAHSLTPVIEFEDLDELPLMKMKYPEYFI